MAWTKVFPQPKVPSMNANPPSEILEAFANAYKNQSMSSLEDGSRITA
jgi:hypothetical protein